MYTFNVKPDGNVETFQNGMRISTGTASAAARYGYGAPAPTPTAMPGSTAAASNTAPSIAFGAVNNQQNQEAERQRQAAITEQNRQNALITQAQGIAGSGSGSISINTFFSGLSSADQNLTRSIFGSNINTNPTTAPSLYKGGANYTGPSIVDFLSLSGQPSDINSRTKLAQSLGLSYNINATGAESANQNTQLLNLLRKQNQSAPPPTPTPTTIGNPINTSSVLSGNTGAPTLPTPQAGNTMATNTASLTLQIEQQKVAVQAEADKRAKEYQTQINDLKKEQADFQTQMDAGLGSLNDIRKEQLERKEEVLTSGKKRFDENYNENQKLIGEMSALLTTGNQLVEEMKGTTGLASIMNPRIAKTMSDVQARAGVIQAVLASRNNQMSLAQQWIGTAHTALSSIYNDQIKYYETVINFYDSQKKDAANSILNITKDQKGFLDNKLRLLDNDLIRLQNTKDKLSEAMSNPATASQYAMAGVTMNDSVEQIGQKLALYAYSQELTNKSNTMQKDGYSLTAIPGVQPFVVTDSQGRQQAWYKRGALTEVSAGSSLIDSAGNVVVTAPKAGDDGGDGPQPGSTLDGDAQGFLDGVIDENSFKSKDYLRKVQIRANELAQKALVVENTNKTPVVKSTPTTAEQKGQETRDFLQTNPYYQTFNPGNLFQGGKDVGSGIGSFFKGLF